MEPALTESMVKVIARPILEKYGSLRTSEVKHHFTEFYTPTDLDMVRKKRGEPKYLQIIGNVVSHQKQRGNLIEAYNNSFEVELDPESKSPDSAIWRLLVSDGTQLEVISEQEVDDRQSGATKRRPRIHRVIKTDWNAVNQQRTATGAAGEEYVYGIEFDHIANNTPYDLERVQHTSRFTGDGTGYDILSYTEDGRTAYIEVKTTTQGPDTPFYITPREYAFLNDHYGSDDTWLRRVSNFQSGPNGYSGDIEELSAADVIDCFDFESTQYRATRRYD